MELQVINDKQIVAYGEAELELLTSSAPVLSVDGFGNEYLRPYIFLHYERIIDGIKRVTDLTKSLYKQRLKHFLLFAQNEPINKDVLNKFYSHVDKLKKIDGKPIAPSTKAAVFGASQIFFKHLYNEHRIPVNIAGGIKNFQYEPYAKVAYSDEAIGKIAAALKEGTFSSNPDVNEWKKTRLKAIFYVLIFQGIRRFQLAEMKKEDVDLLEGRFRVKKKSSTEYDYQPFNPIALEAVKEWFALYETGEVKAYLGLRTKPAIWAFPSIDRSNQGGHVGKSSLNRYVKDICNIAGVTARGVHKFRDSLAIRNFLKYRNISMTQALLGHKNATTTQVYTQKILSSELREEALLNDSLIL